MRVSLSSPALLLARAALARPRLTLALTALLTFAALPGLARLELRTDGHALVPPHDPAVHFDAMVRERFGLADAIVVYLDTGRPGGLYDLASLRRLMELTTELAAFPGIGPERVMSLATERRDRVRPGTLEFMPFLEPFPETQAELDALRADVEAAGIVQGTLVSNDASGASIVVSVPAVGSAGWHGDRAGLCRAIRATVERFDAGPDEVLVAGAPVAESLLGDHILADLVWLLPATLFVVALMIGFACRRAFAIVLVWLEVGAALTGTFGLMGWIGAPIYLTTAVLPVILTAMGIADEIHILMSYQRVLADGRGAPAESAAARAPAILATMELMARPVSLAALTTAIGFLSFLSSEVAPVRSFSVFAATGIALCMLWSVVVMPALLVLSPVRWLERPVAAVVASPRWGRLARFLAERRRGLLAAVLAVTLVASIGIQRLVVTDSWTHGFAERSAFRAATERINAALHGVHVLLVQVDDIGADSVAAQDAQPWTVWRGPLREPEKLRAIGELEAFLRAHPAVGGVLGAASQLEAVHFLWQARRPGMRALPAEAERVDLLLTRFDESRGQHRRREVLDDGLRHAVVTVFMKDPNYVQVRALCDATRAFATEHLAPHGLGVGFAGDVAVSQAMIRAVVRTQVGSLLLALVGALLAALLFYRSPRWALLAVLPAVLSVVWVFGLMGWSGIPLGVATSMFCAVTLGIGVDYGVHFLERLRLRRGTPGVDPAAAAVQEVGPAIVTDALAVACGFGLLGCSRVPANAHLGLLVALALCVSCCVTLFGLGALLSRGVRRLGEP